MIADNLERLYQDARAALKARDYDRASGLLKQILVIDEDYKDASRLLAQAVRLKRRRWYNDPRVWGTSGAVLLLGLGILLAPKAQDFLASRLAPPAVGPVATPTPTSVPTATATLDPTPTPIPLAWKRIALGLEFPRDEVTAFATDKKDPDVIYAAMKNAGVYKSIDGGLSWRPAHQGLANTQVLSLLIDSDDPHILYAGTLGGAYKTQDGGENWFRIGDGTFLLMDHPNPAHLYARDNEGIYESTDQGATWETVHPLKQGCPDSVSSWAIHAADGSVILVAGDESCPGVYRSADRGHTWASIGLTDKPDLTSLFTWLDQGGNLVISTFFQSAGAWADTGYFVTRDGGASWTFTGGPGGGGHGGTAFDPDFPDTIYGASSRPSGMSGELSVLREGHGGWKELPGTRSFVYSAVHIDRLNGVDRILVGGTDVSKQSAPVIGVRLSRDGGMSWMRQDIGLGSARADLRVHPMQSASMYLAVDYTSDFAACWLYRSLDAGTSWRSIHARGCIPTFDAANVLYLMQGPTLQRSWNGGDSWAWEEDSQFVGGRWIDESAKHYLPSDSQGGSRSVSANPYLVGVVYDIGEAIHYSTDEGLSWLLSQGSEGSWDARLYYTDQSKRIYAIGRYHQSYSIDSGKTWQSCGEDVTASRSDSRLAHEPQGSRLYLATPGNGVLISIDNCGSWQPSNDGLGNLFVNTLAVDPINSETIYAGTDGGAYISFDSGETWGQVNDGLLGATVVYSIAVDKDSNVYAATPYGVFKLERQ